MLAQARQIHHEGVFKFAVNLLLHVLEVGVLGTLGEFGAEDFLPIRPPVDFLHPLAADRRTRPGGGHRLGLRRILQIGVVVVPRLVIVVDGGQVGVGEDIGQNLEFAALFGNDFAILDPFPTAVPLLLIFPVFRIADAGLGFDVVEPGVFHAVAGSPNVLTSHRTGVAADALVQVPVSYTHLDVYKRQD